jgi:hypothetical protein
MIGSSRHRGCALCLRENKSLTITPKTISIPRLAANKNLVTMIGQINLVTNDWSKINLVTYDWAIVTEKCPMNGPRQFQPTDERAKTILFSRCARKV